MAIPKSRQEFADYCLRRLGHPVIQINVSAEQVDDRIDNKYLFWYMDLIVSAIENPPTESYTERHHILPKSIYPEYENLSYFPWNGVRLSTRQHFICHALLVRIFEGREKHSMWHAFRFMKGDPTTNKVKYFNSRLYEISKKRHSTYSKKDLSEEHLRKLKEINSKPKSEETKRKMSLARRNLPNPPDTSGKNNGMFGRTGTKSPHFGKKQTFEHKEKRLSQIRGRKHSLESRKLMSINAKTCEGKRWVTNGIEEQLIFPNDILDGWKFGRLKRNKIYVNS